ncbi:hypothetical protein MHYP_G00200480 [Metynnis hypsauchen]
MQGSAHCAPRLKSVIAVPDVPTVSACSSSTSRSFSAQQLPKELAFAPCSIARSESGQLPMLLTKGSPTTWSNYLDNGLHKLTTATSELKSKTSTKRMNCWPPSNLEFLRVGLLMTCRSHTKL